jgi:hypothetical protein
LEKINQQRSNKRERETIPTDDGAKCPKKKMKKE